jgi:hypothetical protein
MKKHRWEPIEESKGFWGYHMYKCNVCGKNTHIGLDIDYEALECPGKPKKVKKTRKEQLKLKFLVDRFLAWPLPKSVCSDQCVCVPNYPNRVGTNLLTADEARQMIEHLFQTGDKTE